MAQSELRPDDHTREDSLANDYEDRVIRLDERTPESLRQTLFGRHCTRFAQFLRTAKSQAGRHDEDFARLYKFPDNSPPVETPFNLHGVQDAAGDISSNMLLFLSGYPSKYMLLRIGSQLDIAPEFFDTHLCFIKHDTASSCDIHPSFYILPSRRQTIFQTSITSIGGAPADLTEKRGLFVAQMEQYHHRLKTGRHWKTFQSIVRAIEVHDARRFSLHQNVTILIKHYEQSGRWLVLVWSDAGADLTMSPEGPWLNSTHGLSNTHFRPVSLLGTSASNVRISSGTVTSRVGLRQSLTLLPSRYGAGIDPRLMAMDPACALAQVFAFISASEAQYLDTIRSVLDDNVTFRRAGFPSNNRKVRGTLVFSYRGLENRRDQITATMDFLNDQPQLQRTTNTSPVLSIIRDYEYLLTRTNELMARCDHEWNVIMSEAAVEDAEWSREQSRSQRKFTILATIYVPLSFSCSVFGMTFFDLSSLWQGFAIWAMVTIPLFLLSFIFLFWNQKYVRQVWRRLRELSLLG